MTHNKKIKHNENNFVHLHNHTDFSFLESTITVKTLINAAKKAKMPAVAITDNGGLFGLIDFYKEAIKEGIKPILGYEAFVAPQSRFDRDYCDNEFKYHHLILLAKNNVGYKNLLKLSTIGYTKSFYYRPRIDKEILRKYSDGLICLSGCIKGEIPSAIIRNDINAAKKALEEYLTIFGKKNFFLELQNHGKEEEKLANEGLIRLSREYNIKVVATNNCHYIKEVEHEAQDVLMCIKKHKKIDEQKRESLNSSQYYFKCYNKMLKCFTEIPEAVHNTLIISEMCNVEIPLNRKMILPSAPKIKGFTDNGYLAYLSKEGLKKKFNNIEHDEKRGIRQRFKHELSTINKRGIAGYLLIIRDIIEAAHTLNIPIDATISSCSGSLICYLISITDINPIKHHLLFERFIHEESKSIPSIRIGFPEKDLYTMKDYIINKYGVCSVCGVGTIGRMLAKTIMRETGRVLGISPKIVNTAVNMIPNGPFVTFEDTLKSNFKFCSFFKQSEHYKKWLRVSITLEGLNRSPGVHHSQIIIAPKEITSYSPLYKENLSPLPVTQYNKKNIEALGLFSIEFATCKTIQIISETLERIEQNHGRKISFYSNNLDNSATYSLFANGNTIAVFQFESEELQKHLKELKPSSFEELIAMNALWRPWQEEETKSYIRRKLGKEKINYYHDDIKHILQETYGLIIYHEQIMQIVNTISGLTFAKANLLRCAIINRNKNQVSALKKEFVDGAVARKYTNKTAISVFDFIKKSSRVSFNKALATACAYIAYKTAYLKANFREDFLKIVIKHSKQDPNRISFLKKNY